LGQQGAPFCEPVAPMFLARDITRHDLRELARRGLRETRGRYKEVLELFGMPSGDYRRVMNFLGDPGGGIAVREFREATSPRLTPPERPPLYSVPAAAPVELAS